MLKAWQRATVIALPGTAAIAGQLAGVGPARAAAPTITINATSTLPVVTHDVWVVYLGGKNGSAKIHGKITGAAPGEVAVLYGQAFPYKKPSVRSARLRSSRACPSTRSRLRRTWPRATG